MKSIFKIALIASLFVIGLPSIQAQKTLEEGHIEYEVTNIDSESMEAQMMMGTMINIYFSKDNSRFSLQAMGGMMAVDMITAKASKTTTLLMNMMGRKIQVEQPEEEKTAEANTPTFDIKYDKSDTKEIAGEKCIKATITEKGSNESVIAYITKKMKFKLPLIEKMFPGLEGVPMEVTIKAQGMSATITAQNVKKSVDASDFDVPEGYEKMTPEEFQKAMEGMGGLGF